MQQVLASLRQAMHHTAFFPPSLLAMHIRAQQLITELQLQAHPEGGYYAEVFRSSQRVQRADGQDRSALTTIIFLLTAGQLSQWHRVQADEVWHFYEGAPLELYIANAPEHQVHTHRLGSVGVDTLPVAVVPAQAWQAARSLGAYTLVGCTVAPGFEFADFTLIDQLPPADRPPLPAL